MTLGGAGRPGPVGSLGIPWVAATGFESSPVAGLNGATKVPLGLR